MTNPDPWLARWLPLARERAGNAPVLELGCGSGQDSAVLAEAGLRVVGVDLSAAAIEKARRRVPRAEFHAMDLREPFPLGAESTGVVVASLSLHYFPWEETVALVRRIRDTLRPGGVLLCRLNSTRDHHYGASGHPRIEDDYYLVDGEPKRFFDRPAVDRLFAAGWRRLAIEESAIARYAKPKVAWEVVMEKAG